VLLRRDPWLVSQTLMQLLYLAPPALMLWRSFADNSAAILLITPVIVMAAGQLGGGLAWLTISGEDAADLVATAPLPASRVTRAKLEVVLIGIGVIFAPLIVALIFASPLQAAVTALGVAVAAASATAIQLWFRVQARRSQFRRRQTSSRLATFAEAFSSIGWAATAALALAWPVVAVVTGLATAGMLAATWKISPRARVIAAVKRFPIGQCSSRTPCSEFWNRNPARAVRTPPHQVIMKRPAPIRKRNDLAP
jgi:ABC-2 type transport system permease protein